MSDLISRSALKKVISEYIDEYSDLDNEGYHNEKWCAMKEAEMAIDNAPTAEPKTGEWIDTGDMQEYWSEEFKCSICGAKDHWHNFCPNCGAYMRKGEEE